MLTFLVVYVIMGLVTSVGVNFVVRYGKCWSCVVWITLLWPMFVCITLFILATFLYMYLVERRRIR